MLTLGHIKYSNCFPPHAGILTNKVAFPFRVVAGIPSGLNRLLSDGTIDISPSSSIEYAMNSERYLLLPDLSITAHKKVMSIILQSRVPLDGLRGKRVALTTASATSVVLLRILLELQHAVKPSYIFYEQGIEHPWINADAFLTIGDLAITQPTAPGFSHRYDLAELWHEHTGLPFVFALWQVNYKKNIEKDLQVLYDILQVSRSYGLSHLRELAHEHENEFNIAADVLFDYWRSFRYHFGDEEQKGLIAYYERAARINVIERVPELKFWKRS